MKKQLLLLTLLLLTFFSFGQVPTSERDALIAIYNATDGPNWDSYDAQNWNTSNPVSTWRGITVGNINGQDHIIGILIRSNDGMSGSLPPEIGDFPELTNLQIRSCPGLTGNIPSEIGNLTKLEELDLFFNDLSGTIPATLSNLTQLKSVYLNSNHLSGVFPDLTNCPQLKHINITTNDFDFAGLEPHYQNLKNLCVANGGGLYVSPMNPIDNELSIDMVNGNSYTFNMPTVNGTGVTYQWYHNDQAIPGETGQTLQINNAQHSDLGDYTCKASSPIVTDLTIDRSFIHLYGPVIQSDYDALMAIYNATDGSNWTDNTNWGTSQSVYTWHGIKMRGDRVSEIDLSENNLNGTIPSAIGDLTELIKINFSKNGGWNYYPGNLHGAIPPEIGNLSNLKDLWITLAKLSGNIPPEIGNLTNLESLGFWVNDLTGTIPDELGNLINLKILTLEENDLTGNIPVTFANLTAMENFWVNGNQLSGDIPDIFQNWPNLDFFSIGYYEQDSNHNTAFNNFTGDLDLSQNTHLRWCTAQSQSLSTINVRNGNNHNFYPLYADDNSHLTCVFVDDANASYLSNWHIDPTAHFVENQAECDASSINDETLQQNIEIYPNPTNGILYINNEQNIVLRKVIVYNFLGQVVKNNTDMNKIDITNLPNGIYYVGIETDKKDKAFYKVIKE